MKCIVTITGNDVTVVCLCLGMSVWAVIRIKNHVNITLKDSQHVPYENWIYVKPNC